MIRPCDVGRDIEVAFIDYQTPVAAAAAAVVSGGRGQELGQLGVGRWRVLLALGQQVVCQGLHSLVGLGGERERGGEGEKGKVTFSPISALTLW